MSSSLYKQLGLSGAGSPLTGRHVALLILGAGFLALTVFVVHPNEFRIQSFFAGSSSCGGRPGPDAAAAAVASPHGATTTTEKEAAARAPAPAPDDDDVRVLIGIQTLPSKRARRHLLRDVYSLQAQEHPSVAGSVDVRFVFCNVTSPDDAVLVALEAIRYGDIIVMDCAENMDNGKTYTFFSTVRSARVQRQHGQPPATTEVRLRDEGRRRHVPAAAGAGGVAARRGEGGRLLRAADAVRHGELLPFPALHVRDGVRAVVGPGAVGGVLGPGPARAGRARGHVDGAVAQRRRQGQEPVRQRAEDVQLQGRVAGQLLPARLRPGHHRCAHAQGRRAVGRDARLLQRHRRTLALRRPLPPAAAGGQPLMTSSVKCR